MENETTADDAVWAVQIGNSIGLLVLRNTLGVSYSLLEVTNVTLVTVVVSTSVINAIRVEVAASRGTSIAQVTVGVHVETVLAFRDVVDGTSDLDLLTGLLEEFD